MAENGNYYLDTIIILCKLKTKLSLTFFNLLVVILKITSPSLNFKLNSFVFNNV